MCQLLAASALAAFFETRAFLRVTALRCGQDGCFHVSGLLIVIACWRRCSYPWVMKLFTLSFVALICITILPGCLTQRTVTQGGQTVSQNYVIKRPLKEVVQNSRQ